MTPNQTLSHAGDLHQQPLSPSELIKLLCSFRFQCEGAQSDLWLPVASTDSPLHGESLAIRFKRLEAGEEEAT